ncbi:MAG: transglycosylase domain-containing protein [Bacteroidota bacterium]
MTETTKDKLKGFLHIKKDWIPNTIRYVWYGFLCLLIGLPLFILSVQIDLFGLYGGMPSLADVENPENDLSSEIISADSVSLGRYFRFNRSPVAYEQLSPDLVNTLILSEDHRFQEHSGIDFPAYVRVFFGLLTLNPQGGGSTITQQLAKNLYTRNPDRSLDGHLAILGGYVKRLIEKVKEWTISIELERNFTKEEIIAMYFNTTEFSSNSYGIKVAAETYFGKQPDSLNILESSVLVGMLQNPSWYNPKNHPERAFKKRNEVLYKLYKADYKIDSREMYDSLIALPLGLNFKVQNQNQGLAPYFRTVLGAYLQKFCKERNINLWNSGLKIYTTIDSRLQRYAEEAVQEQMAKLQKDFQRTWGKRNPWVDDNSRAEIKGFLDARIKQTDYYRYLVNRYGKGNDSIRILLNLKKPMTIFTYDGEVDTVFSSMDSINYYKRFLQTGFLAMEPETGYIKAWVGGVNHKYFKFDHVKQSARQPGSTFKPFVYGMAIEAGHSPCEIRKDVSPSFKVPGRVWSPENSEGGHGNGEEMTIRQALARSVNSVTAQLMQSVGINNVVEFAHRVGIESTLDPVPSLCLGTSDVTLYEMIGAYSTFVNAGIHTRPFFLTRIEDKNGNIIENFIPESRQAINEQTAYKMVYMLRGGVEERMGTSGGLSAEVRRENEIGGKTGTTDNASDGWYVGITQNLVAGAWVGGDERAIHFPSWNFGQGSKTARPIWEKFMLKAYNDPATKVKRGAFKRPVSGVDVSLDCKNITVSDSLKVEEEKPWEIP